MTRLAVILLILSAAVLAWGCRGGGAGSRRQAPAGPERPRILSVSTQPELPNEGGWTLLPPGPGEIRITVVAEGATRVKVFLVPGGTEQRVNARLIGEDGDPRDGWSVAWRFPDADLLAHILVRAAGPGGVAEDESLQVSHERAR